ncbi:MAG TPA: hypothetical protein VE891_01545 [Allosphingosinicella sp.]|nr:hypothetical protein [Allosphingosinicella sp.]
MTREKSSRLSRRALLAGLGFGVAAAGAFATPALHLDWTRKPGAKGSWWDRRSASLAKAGIDEWSRQIGSEFALAGGAIAKLAEVQSLHSPGRRPDGLRDGAFALIFESTGAGLPAGDRTLEVSHAQGGAMKIYFSACGDKCGSRRLQAIFN